jgi:putative ATP-dependent endonuclease of the OLD family
MAKIYSLQISNFRGIRNFSQVFNKADFICLIGRNDAGKSTILEAISLVLSPNWNLTFYDSDFYNCDINNQIEIEVSLFDLPDQLLLENKFGLYIRGFDNSTNEISDVVENNHESILTIKLLVDKYLEPKWYVVNGRNQEPAQISHYDRAKLNVYIISDFVDRHFSWSKGNPLYSLLKMVDTPINTENDSNPIIEILRETKSKIDETKSLDKFNNATAKIIKNANNLGVDISKAFTSIDFKDISIKDGRVCLHDENDKTPFRLKGKGTKRLISMAIQTALIADNGIILIDEIEQGLEPDRVRHLVNILKKDIKGQIFITTHSNNVLVELDSHDLFMMIKGANKLEVFKPDLQGCLRTNPDAFFATKIIVCEGSTEIGICRALNDFRIKKDKKNASYLGVVFANGEGANIVEYCRGFKNAGLQVCLFCDSDVNQKNGINEKKDGLKRLGIEIVDWDDGDCLEVAITKNLSATIIKKLIYLYINIQVDTKGKNKHIVIKSITDTIQSSYGINCPSRITDDPKLKNIIGNIANDKGWFKSITNGEKLGNLLFEHYDELKDTQLQIQLDKISNWIDNE